MVGNRDDMEELCRFVTAHSLVPVVGAVFPLAQVADAFAAMRRGPIGKVVVAVGAHGAHSRL